MKILSFDIGGTKISSAIVLADGQLAENVLTIKTPSTAQKIEEFLQKRISQTEFDGLAVATAGVVWDEKLVAKPHNLPEGYENIKFHNLCHKPVLVENDANSAVEKEVNARGYHNPLQLKMARTEADAGLIGAALLLKDKINE